MSIKKEDKEKHLRNLEKVRKALLLHSKPEVEKLVKELKKIKKRAR